MLALLLPVAKPQQCEDGSQPTEYLDSVSSAQDYDINVVHIESHRTNSEYEFYVDLEADRVRVQQSVKALKEELSCVDSDSGILLECNENRPRVDLSQTVKTATGTNNNERLHLPPFSDQHGQTLGRQSELQLDKSDKN